jgi:zinc transporter
MARDDGLVCAYLRSLDGHWREVGWPEIDAWRPEDGLLWLHLDRLGEAVPRYLRAKSGLEPIVVEALLEHETRPRSVAIGEGLLVILRGVNLNPGAEPEDMVSIRMWLEANRVITTRHRRLMAVNDVREQIARGDGPRSPGELLARLADCLVHRMAGVVDDLEAREDEIETALLDGESSELRTQLAQIRRRAISLRRYLAPQREALGRLQGEAFEWLGAADKIRLREVTDRVMRYVEDLDSVRDRAGVIQDELVNRLSEQMNRNMYVLSVVATIMLPLGFFTGLLGVNVDGIPGEDTPWAFAVLCAILGVLIVVELWLFKRLRWL